MIRTGARAEPLPFGLAGLCVLAAAVMVLDGYDLQVMALLVPALSEAWAVTPDRFGWVLSAPLLGLGLGAALIAPLGDRLGRRSLALSGFALLTSSVALSASCDQLWSLGACRLVTGLALGMTLPNTTALVAEMAPARLRAGLLTLVSIGISVGAVASGLIAPLLIRWGGWQATFLMSASIGLAVLVALILWLPESPAVLAARGGSASDRAPRRGTAAAAYLAVLSSEYRIGTLAFWALFASNAFMVYLVSSWLPVLLTGRGWPLAQASGAIAAFQGGGLAGGLIVAVLMDRWRADCALISAYALAVLGIAALMLPGDDRTLWTLAIISLGAGVGGAFLAVMAVAAIVYPPRMLSTGVGLGVAVARLGAIAGPLAGALLIARGLGAEEVLLLLLPAIAICCLAITVIVRSPAGANLTKGSGA